MYFIEKSWQGKQRFTNEYYNDHIERNINTL
jgi:hypothetical protein